MRFALAILTLCLSATAYADSANEKRGLEFFEKKIRPVLVKHCYECHSSSADDVGGSLLLDSREGTRAGGEMGPAVVPGNVQESLLIQALNYESVEMPPDGKLSQDVIDDFKRWVSIGAPDPRDGEARGRDETDQDDERGPLWSLQPLAKVSPPTVKGADWPKTDIDRFVFQKLQENHLQPVADADPVALMRRLSFDLAGLPPSLEHLQRVQSNPSAETVEAIIDELIASPQFGQRWARHWLDAARYAESAGSSRDVLMPYAWKYRNYVIDAFNKDLPYPQFIAEQVAGDLLDAQSPKERRRLQVATGFLAVGQKSLNGGNIELDVVDDQIDVVGKAVLGLTISCARCHDHKFDPIPTRDYYSLAGIFLSTDTLYGGGTRRPKDDAEKLKVYLPLSGEQSVDEFRDIDKQLVKLAKQKTTIAKRVQSLTKKLPKDWKKQKADLESRSCAATDEDAQPLSKKEEKLFEQIDELEQSQAELKDIQQKTRKLNEEKKSVAPLEFAVGVREGKKIAATKIRIRGEKNQQGDVAPRGFLKCLSVEEEPIDDSQSGRRQLAKWLTAPHNPLTPRVAVNRVWLHLFGRGIVGSADNFGASGQAPSHPALLDYLANRFVENGWSHKKLIREIVMSRTYRLASDYDEQNYAVDPDNRLLWRASRRRLEAEAIRDAMLAASGELNLAPPPFGSSVAKIGEGEVGRNLNTKPLSEPFPYRSVYLPVIRGLLPRSMSLFDFPDPANPQSVRDSTNVPAQSLYFMNSDFVIRRAEQTAKRVIRQGQSRADRIAVACELVLGRAPSESEIDRIDGYLSDCLQDGGENALQSAWSTVCQSLFASAEFRHLH